MIAILNVTYPSHSFKQVVAAFTSPDIPKRQESMREVSSIGYFDDNGTHATFMFDIPDAQVADFLALQGKRSAFISGRVPGFISCVHVGRTVAESIKEYMPMYP